MLILFYAVKKSQRTSSNRITIISAEKATTASEPLNNEVCFEELMQVYLLGNRANLQF